MITDISRRNFPAAFAAMDAEIFNSRRPYPDANWQLFWLEQHAETMHLPILRASVAAYAADRKSVNFHRA